MISVRSRVKRLFGFSGFGGFLLVAFGYISWLNEAAQTVQFALTATGNSAVALVWNDLFMQHANAWVTGLGFLLLVWVIVKPESKSESSKLTIHPKRGIEALTVVKGQAKAVLIELKHLDHDHREQVQLPLNNSSLPALNQSWGFVDVRLASLRNVLDVVTCSAKALYETYNWEDKWIDLFQVGQGTKMLDLIAALEEFTNAEPSVKPKPQV